MSETAVLDELMEPPAPPPASLPPMSVMEALEYLEAVGLLSAYPGRLSEEAVNHLEWMVETGQTQKFESVVSGNWVYGFGKGKRR